MKNNIFENAYFGKEYKTRDGRKAIYHLKEKEYNEHILIFDNWYAFIRYKSNGKYLGGNSNIDIVSEWQKEINEEKLDKIADDEAQLYSVVKSKEWQEGFKVGYRKAKRKQK